VGEQPDALDAVAESASGETMTSVSEKEQEIARLRERLQLLEQHNYALLRGVPDFPPAWKLTAGEARLLTALAMTGKADMETLLKAVRLNDNAKPALVKTLVSSARRKLQANGVAVEIHNDRGEGYIMRGHLPTLRKDR
jgi:hypothetical protein